MPTSGNVMAFGLLNLRHLHKICKGLGLSINTCHRRERAMKGAASGPNDLSVGDRRGKDISFSGVATTKVHMLL